MLSTIMGMIISPLLDKLIGPLLEAFKAYQNKQISLAELKEKIQAMMLSATRDIEITQAEELTKTYTVFMASMEQDKFGLLKAVWASVVITQLLVLLWSQFGISAAIAMGLITRWPSAGTTADWSYALIAACLGFGPVILRSGPGNASGGLVASLRALLGK